MFNSHKSLKRKTPNPGINREEYITHLVDEYYTTTDLEAQEQVSANLSNFAYDPINWEYLKKADVFRLFLELLDVPNETLQLHGLAGLCNISLDHEIFANIRKPEHFSVILQVFLKSQNKEILLNCCTIIYQLLSNDKDSKGDILTGEALKRIQHLNNQFKSNKRLLNITSILLEDFGRRYELVEGSCSNDGTKLKFVKKFSQEDLDTFSQLTGDFNNLHSAKIPANKRMVHGAFLNAIIAGLIGTHFPGPGTVVLEQNFKFPKPCRIDEDCEFLIQLKEQRKISTLSYKCKQHDNIVFEGEAKLLISNNNTIIK